MDADVDTLVRGYVQDHMHVHCASTPSRPNALIGALARAFAGSRSLTVSVAAVHSNAHALAISDACDRVITGFLGEVYPYPRPNPLYAKLVEGKPYTVELWSLLTLHQRLAAAAQGLPYAVTTSLIGSDLVDDNPGVVGRVPGSVAQSTALLLSPLRPDITLLHGSCADRAGNVLIYPPVGEGLTSALAARLGVLASVERFVDDVASIEVPPGAVVVPGSRVLAVCRAAFGAHPQGLPGSTADPGYLDDGEFITELAEVCGSAESARRWYDTWIHRCSHADYLRRLGSQRLSTLRETGDTVASRASRTGAGELGERGRLVVLAARTIVDLVETQGYETILAGIGASHLATWLAQALLREKGHTVRVCAETGLYGMDPAPGDVYLFSQRHTPRCQALMGTNEVLSALVSENAGRCLGVLSAAQVDRFGNVNTTLLPDGRWLTGSGGANDIASRVDCVVACTARRHRFVRRVAHVTSPGRRVRAVVCQFGRFKRATSTESFRLATWMGSSRLPDRNSALEALTDWEALGLDSVEEEEISPTEARLLHQLDPAGIYH
jgi:acyl CoA:acetate/3-ketoacid CoA transferase alpha subunit/acyl CoA:acetate/3-ketoacid CoA transferase beta subunit